ncbi:hypothetical protein K505DRAFT_357385 [Melanomma pulvis-pyrius CBS 109.77]|uniref:Uncharacterized protein n=1 Tax=Melanomma pulvis-pyrius CBS 109.77 TaxID=1314802 RepID=A0A6A6XQ99_9PLEO|nr:hypothetical protein K505DRAFT_357385 [Melanomma pulvis-pyrius CBS 109.77]
MSIVHHSSEALETLQDKLSSTQLVVLDSIPWDKVHFLSTKVDDLHQHSYRLYLGNIEQSEVYIHYIYPISPGRQPKIEYWTYEPKNGRKLNLLNEYNAVKAVQVKDIPFRGVKSEAKIKALAKYYFMRKGVRSDFELSVDAKLVRDLEGALRDWAKGNPEFAPVASSTTSVQPKSRSATDIASIPMVEKALNRGTENVSESRISDAEGQSTVPRLQPREGVQVSLLTSAMPPPLLPSKENGIPPAVPIIRGLSIGYAGGVQYEVPEESQELVATFGPTVTSSPSLSHPTAENTTLALETTLLPNTSPSQEMRSTLSTHTTNLIANLKSYNDSSMTPFQRTEKLRLLGDHLLSANSMRDKHDVEVESAHRREVEALRGRVRELEEELERFKWDEFEFGS